VVLGEVQRKGGGVSKTIDAEKRGRKPEKGLVAAVIGGRIRSVRNLGERLVGPWKVK